MSLSYSFHPSFFQDFLFFTLSIFPFSCGEYNEVWYLILAWIPVSYCFSCGSLVLFSKVSSASLISQSGSFALLLVIVSTVIDLAIYSGSWTTMNTASGPGVKGTSFTAIPQFSKIINIRLRYNWLWSSGSSIILNFKF